MNAANELLKLVKEDNINDFNRIGRLMAQINKQNTKQGNDFSALREGEEYVERMQKLLGQQN